MSLTFCFSKKKFDFVAQERFYSFFTKYNMIKKHFNFFLHFKIILTFRKFFNIFLVNN